MTSPPPAVLSVERCCLDWSERRRQDSVGENRLCVLASAPIERIVIKRDKTVAADIFAFHRCFEHVGFRLAGPGFVSDVHDMFHFQERLSRWQAR